MPNIYPSYNELDITKYETLFGFYVLGFIKQHRPDIDIVDIRLKNNSWECQHSEANYDWLEDRIQQGLKQNKKVALIVDDEHVFVLKNEQLTNILNQYIDHPVYWITMMDQNSIDRVYIKKHGFKNKILELPWMMLNECLTYYPVADTVTDFKTTNYNYVCLVGNTLLRYPDNHKLNLVRELNRQGLVGLNMLSPAMPYPEEMLEYCQVNSEFIYKPADLNYPIYARQYNLNGVWVSKNVENYLDIAHKYRDIPLAINPETTTRPFMSTEKSIWPVLLGKLFLIYGRPGSMAWIQRFYDINITRFANIEYDSILNNRKRLVKMIEDNKDLIANASAVYNELRTELEQARWTLGRNLYNFCCSQLDKIE